MSLLLVISNHGNTCVKGNVDACVIILPFNLNV